MAPFNGKYSTSYVMAIVISISHHLRDYRNQINAKRLTLKLVIGRIDKETTAKLQKKDKRKDVKTKSDELHEEESDKEESNEVKQMKYDEEEDEMYDNEILDDYKLLTSDGLFFSLKH